MSVTESLNDGLEVKTDTMDLLKRGFNKTVELANEARKHWEEKTKNGGHLYRCNACGKSFKTEKSAKSHITKTDTCKSKNLGYKEITDVKIEADDRKLSSDQDEIMYKMKMAREATAEIRKSYADSRNPNGRKISVVDLNRCSPSGFEDMLKRTDTDILKKYISQRFHPSNSSRKYIAEKELKRRS